MKKYLVLFLMILLVVGTVVQVNAEEFTSDEWIGEVTQDPLTDEFQFIMINVYDSSEALIVRYKDGSLSIYIGTEYLGTDHDEYSQEVMYRFDKDEVVEASWGTASDDTALFFSENNTDTKKDFIEKLMDHEELAVGYWPYNEGRKTVVFDLAGFTAGITPYLDQIGLSELK